MITIRVKGPEGAEKLHATSEYMRNELFKALIQGAELIARTSRQRYLSGPYPLRLSPDGTGKDSQNLQEKGPVVVAGLSDSPGELGRIVAQSGVWYGKIHEWRVSRVSSEGENLGAFAAPFHIYAKSKKGMTFFWKRRGFWVHGAKMVTIPPRPWLYPAMLDSIGEIKMLLKSALLKGFSMSKGKGAV